MNLAYWGADARVWVGALFSLARLCRVLPRWCVQTSRLGSGAGSAVRAAAPQLDLGLCAGLCVARAVLMEPLVLFTEPLTTRLVRVAVDFPPRAVVTRAALWAPLSSVEEALSRLRTTRSCLRGQTEAESPGA